MTEDSREASIEGIILNVDYGFGMKYADTDNMYLKLEIQQFNGHSCVQLFKQDDIGRLLLQFKSDYRGEISLKNLRHCQIFLSNDITNGVPNAIAKMPPEKYPQYSWIENSNW